MFRAFLVAIPFFAFGSGIALADTVNIRPGQCIMIGGQQVCALACDGTTMGMVPTPSPRIITNSVCKFGAVDEDDKIKGYGHYLIRINPDGSKVENLLKNFGPAGKQECEREAKSYHD